MVFDCIRFFFLSIFCLILWLYSCFPLLVLLVSSSNIVFIFKFFIIFSGNTSFHWLSLLLLLLFVFKSYLNR